MFYLMDLTDTLRKLGFTFDERDFVLDVNHFIECWAEGRYGDY